MRKDKNIAIRLRKQGKSYNEIVKILKAPKSTLSLWLRDVKMPAAVKRKLWNEARRKWAKNITEFNKKQIETARKKANERQRIAAKDIVELSKRELLLIGTALYWAEGSKKDRWALKFSNSDSAIIKLIMKFFREVCNVPEEKIKAKAHIYPRMNYQKTLNFWSMVTKLPNKNFYKPQIQVSRASKGKRPRNTLPYGTLHLTVMNTEIACKVKGWIQGIVDEI